ncbi:unnamed protein product, partial [Hapterophycus canaliculatus]
MLPDRRWVNVLPHTHSPVCASYSREDPDVRPYLSCFVHGGGNSETDTMETRKRVKVVRSRRCLGVVLVIFAGARGSSHLKGLRASCSLAADVLTISQDFSSVEFCGDGKKVNSSGLPSGLGSVYSSTLVYPLRRSAVDQ